MGSPLLQRHLQGKHEAHSDGEGSFSFGLKAEVSSFLLVTAAGCAPQVVPVRAALEGTDLGEVALSQGGEVELELAGPDVWGEKKPWLVLYPREATESLTVEEERATRELEQKRARLLRCPESHAQPTVLSGVPPGTYIPVLQPQEEVIFAFGQAPTLYLPPVAVLPGGRTRISSSQA